MKFVIAIQTCERFDFFKKCVDTLLEYNPLIEKYTWVIADDASKDGKTQDYIKSLKFIDDYILNDYRLGITGTLKLLLTKAAIKGDFILYIQNDWFCNRYINIDAVNKFFGDNQEIGNIKCIRYKGRYNVKERFAGTYNYCTNESVEEYGTIDIDGEKFTKGTWPWADTPGFIRSEAVYCLFKGYNPNKKINKPEKVRGKNFFDTGWRCGLLENQAFWNLDYDRKKSIQTPGRKK